MKIHGYNCYAKNTYKINNINHKIKDDFITNYLEISNETTLEIISLTTTYSPLRRIFLLLPNIHKMACENHLAYTLADLNVQSRFFLTTRKTELEEALTDS